VGVGGAFVAASSILTAELAVSQAMYFAFFLALVHSELLSLSLYCRVAGGGMLFAGLSVGGLSLYGIDKLTQQAQDFFQHKYTNKLEYLLASLGVKNTINVVPSNMEAKICKKFLELGIDLEDQSSQESKLSAIFPEDGSSDIPLLKSATKDSKVLLVVPFNSIYSDFLFSRCAFFNSP
jgi:hypothetical protein